MSNKPEDHQWADEGRSTMLTFMLTFLVGGTFVTFMIVVTGGFFSYVLLISFLLGLVGCVHYLFWGRAFTEQVQDEREAMMAQEEEEEPHPWERTF